MTTVKYLPARVDLEWWQGDDVEFQFTIRDKNLGGNTASAEARRKRDASSDLIASFTVVAVDDGDDTEVTVTLASGDNTETGKGYWDLQIEDGSGNVRTYLEGEVLVKPEVTS